jgi:23S rRNA (pseudouridine1915-N3)-methyltransferase
VIWKILAVGKPRLSFAAAGINEYIDRILHYARVEKRFIRASTTEREAAELLEASQNSWRTVLDERGLQVASRQFAKLIERWEFQGIRNISLIVGGADGHNETVRKKADFVLSLGRMTLQHELALLVALEQIYRAYTILNGSPYHRD